MAPDRVLAAPLDALGDRASGRRRRLGLRHGLVLLLLAALTGIFPLAYASPPDPVWVGGIYDGADYDDVVSLLTSECVGKEYAPVEVAWRPRVIARGLASTADPIHPLAPVSALHLRSPPAA